MDSIGESETLNIVNANGHNGCGGVRDRGDGCSVKGGVGEKYFTQIFSNLLFETAYRKLAPVFDDSYRKDQSSLPETAKTYPGYKISSWL